MLKKENQIKTRDIQLSNFVTNDDVIILHQGEKVGTTALNRTYDDIIFRSEKPPEVTGIPDITHSEMRLKLVFFLDTFWINF